MKEKEHKTIRYKIRIIADIEGELDEDCGLIEDTSIEKFLTWAAEHIEHKLESTCDIVGVKKVELEEL